MCRSRIYYKLSKRFYELIIKQIPKPYSIQEAICSSVVKTATDIEAR